MSNDTNQHGLTDDELGGRLRRAAWSLFLIGPLGALIGGAMKNKPKPPDVTSPPAGRWRQRPVFGGLRFCSPKSRAFSAINFVG